MNAKTFLLTTVALCGFAVAVAWREANATRATNASVASLQQQRAAATGRLKELEDRLALTQKQQGDLRRTLEALKHTPETPPAPTVSAPKPSTPASELEGIHQDPKLQLLWLASRRALASENYGPLFQSLGLSPKQVTKFQDIAIAREEKNMDLSGVMRAQGLSPQDPLVAKLQHDADAEYEAAQNELLGPEGVQQLHDYERAIPARDIVSGLAGAAAVAGRPLTAEQAEQLTQLLTTASPGYQNGGAADPAAIDWKAVDARARTILSEPQFTLFQTAEPERGNNLRFGSQAGKLLMQARQADASGQSNTKAGPPGGE